MNRALHMAATILVLVFAIQMFANNQADVDLWGNVGFVKALPGSAQFLRANTFSFTEPDHAWTNHEWLSEYILFSVHAHLGNAGLMTLKILAGLALLSILSLSMRRDGVPGPVRLISLLLILSTLGYGFSTRPHLFTYILYASWLFLLRHHADRKWLLLVVPATGLLWANLHGAFFIGVLLLLLFAGLSWAACLRTGTWRPPAMVVVPLVAAVIVVALSLINPYGIDLWNFLAVSAAKPRPYLTEWAPFNPVRDLLEHPDFVMLAILSALVLLRDRRQVETKWAVILAVSFVAALALRRNIPLFAITCAFVIPRHVANAAGAPLNRILRQTPAPAMVAILVFLTVVSAAAALARTRGAPFQIEVPQDRFPSEIIAYMKDNQLEGNALVFWDWAECAIHHLYPRCRVFADGRFNDAYSNQTIDDYFGFLYGQAGAESVPDAYRADILLLPLANYTCQRMLTDARWAPACSNSIACLLLRKTVHADFLERAAAGEDIPLRPQREVYFP